MDNEIYSRITFFPGYVCLESCAEWDITFGFEQLTNPSVNHAADVHDFFNPMTVGRFICLGSTAQLFEKQNIAVFIHDPKPKTNWLDILMTWIDCYCEHSLFISRKSMQSKHASVMKKFKMWTKRYNSRGLDRVKAEMVEFLNAELELPNCEVPGSPKPVIRDSISNPEPVVSSSLRSGTTLRLSDRSAERKVTSLRKTVTHYKKKCEEMSRDMSDYSNLQTAAERLRSIVGVRSKDMMANLASKEEELKIEKEINSDLRKKVRGYRDLELKARVQGNEITSLSKRVGELSALSMDCIADAADAERSSNLLQEELVCKRREINNVKKKLERRERDVTSLQTQLTQAHNKFNTDQAALELYYNGIVDAMKDNANFTVEKLQRELQSLKSLETLQGGKYKAEVRLMYYDLLTKGVSCNIVQDVIRSVVEFTHKGVDSSKVSLPSRSTAQRMVGEAGYLAKIRATYELVRQEDKLVGHQSDGTTKNLIHWGAHALRLQDNDDPDVSNAFTLTISPVSSGKADDTVKQLENQFKELEAIACDLGLEHDDFCFSVDRIGARMSDRAANEKRVTKLLIERKAAKLAGCPEWEYLSEDERKSRINIYGFTCAAHKVDNMAEAMTSASSNYLYGDVDTTARRGMRGAKKHIYETNKLLCERSRKEYSLGADYKAYTLSAELDTGSDLFRPIVGNRYLIFLQNSIPTLSGKDTVMVYLEDVRDGKGTVGLNRLEQSVQSGFLDNVVECEEVAYAVMYHRVCSKLLAKAKSANSPIEMNDYYQTALDYLGMASADASSLLDGSDEMWLSNNDDDAFGEAVRRVQTMGDRETVLSILQVMSRAGMEKLASHAAEHLPGGQYHRPTPEMIEAAEVIGEATNDRIESMFGMLDRRLSIAPSSNPTNVCHLIAAKNDKVVDWTKENVTDLEGVCHVARKFAGLEKKEKGTRNVQLKRMHEEKKSDRQNLIAKRRRLRVQREETRKNLLAQAENSLVMDSREIDRLTTAKINLQCQMWRALSSTNEVRGLQSLKGFATLRILQKRDALKTIVKLNGQGDACVPSGECEGSACASSESDWSTSDEETLDTFVSKN